MACYGGKNHNFQPRIGYSECMKCGRRRWPSGSAQRANRRVKGGKPLKLL